jgi:hypothetical protein
MVNKHAFLKKNSWKIPFYNINIKLQIEITNNK